MRTPIRELLLQKNGKREGESVKEWLVRITADSHPDDHKHRSALFDDLCIYCGWIGPEAKCADCNEPAIAHARIYVEMVEKLGPEMAELCLSKFGFAIVLPPVTVSIKQRRPFSDRLN